MSTKTVKIPARHRKMVRTKIEGGVSDGLLMFTPETQNGTFQLADAVLDGGCGACQTLIVCNTGEEPTILSQDTLLGTVTIADEIVSLKSPGTPRRSAEDEEAGIRVCTLEPRTARDERRGRLLEELELDLAHLTSEERSDLEDLIVSYADTFALDPSELCSSTCAEHVINTGDGPPIRQPARRMPFALREEVDHLVHDMLSQQVIVPSASPWASPIVLVRKKDGGMRFCVQVEQEH